MNKHTPPMRKRYLLFFLYIGIVLLNGCKSIDLPKGTSKGYSTYSIYKHSPERMPDFSSRKDRSHEIIKDTIRQKFSEKGLKELESIDDAELVVAYLVVVQDNATSAAIRDYYINSGTEILSEAHKRHRKKAKKSKKYYTDSYLTGTLIVDVIDTESNELIYRDYATRLMFDSMAEEERDQAVVEAVSEVTAKFLRK